MERERVGGGGGKTEGGEGHTYRGSHNMCREDQQRQHLWSPTTMERISV